VVTDDAKLAVAAAYRAATEANDAPALRALHEPDARTWHNVDGMEVSVDDSARTLAWLHERVPDLGLHDVRLLPTADGFVARWTMVGTAPGGPLRLHSCVVAELSPDGRVARAAEYIDSAALAVLRRSR
jgi:ketosteroid isomerase-like protein